MGCQKWASPRGFSARSSGLPTGRLGRTRRWPRTLGPGRPKKRVVSSSMKMRMLPSPRYSRLLWAMWTARSSVRSALAGYSFMTQARWLTLRARPWPVLSCRTRFIAGTSRPRSGVPWRS